MGPNGEGFRLLLVTMRDPHGIYTLTQTTDFYLLGRGNAQARLRQAWCAPRRKGRSPRRALCGLGSQRRARVGDWHVQRVDSRTRRAWLLAPLASGKDLCRVSLPARLTSIASFPDTATTRSTKRILWFRCGDSSAHGVLRLGSRELFLGGSGMDGESIRSQFASCAHLHL